MLPFPLARDLFHRTKPTLRLDFSNQYFQLGLKSQRPRGRPLKIRRGFVLLLDMD